MLHASNKIDIYNDLSKFVLTPYLISSKNKIYVEDEAELVNFVFSYGFVDYVRIMPARRYIFRC